MSTKTIWFRRGDGTMFECDPDSASEKNMRKEGFQEVFGPEEDAKPVEVEKPTGDGLEALELVDLQEKAAHAGVKDVGSMDQPALIEAIRKAAADAGNNGGSGDQNSPANQ